MAVRDILLLGHPKLWETCATVERDEIDALRPVVDDLHDTLFDFRSRHNAGRAIAAPQIGVMKRLVYMHVGEPVVFLNPVLDEMSPETMELWDDCMSFPDLLVRVRRHRACRITYRDLDWVEHQRALEDDLSELLQHEVDHLDGILAVERAVAPKAFSLRDQLLRVRAETEADRSDVRRVNEHAFETAFEAELVDELRQRARPLVSLVAEKDRAVVGHILFSPVELPGHPELQMLGLAPMAVLPEHQRQGIGSALVRAGLEECKKLDVEAVIVLGHPEYYPRFGFEPAAHFGLTSKYDAPSEAFMALELQAGSLEDASGEVRYHPAFDD